MKKRAILPSVIKGMVAFCLLACLFPLIYDNGCRLAYKFLPEAILEYPCTFMLRHPPSPSPSSISTEASVPVTNAQVHVSFKQPEGWTLIKSGVERNVPLPLGYATYGLKGQPDPPTLNITYQPSGTPISPDDLDRLVEIEIYSSLNSRHIVHVVDELRETIDGLPAFGVRYVKEDQVGFSLRVSQLYQTIYFEWTSDRKYSHELEEIYYAILPTIRIERPPQ